MTRADAPRPAPVELAADRRPVPVRTILAVIGLLLATAVVGYVVVLSRTVLTWMVVGMFFAVALYPVAGFVQRRLLGGRYRSVATLIVFLLVVAVIAAVAAAFALPLASEGTKLAGQLPTLVEQARNGKGPVGHVLQQTHVLNYIQQNQSRISSLAKSLATPAVGVLTGLASGIAGAVTIFVLAYLMVLEGPKFVDGFVGLFPETTGQRIRRVGADCARSVTGYISGNLLISVICGGLTFAVLHFLGVGYAGLIALFVGIADLVPLVGATIGGVVAVVAGLVHSLTAGIVVLVFFVLYQQVENHLLQPVVFARTVQLNPLTVIIAILVASELAGILGALLAIPAASIIQVVVRDLWDHRRGRPKPEPTVGQDERPAEGAPADGLPASRTPGEEQLPA